MPASEEINHDILLIITIALVILFITNINVPGQGTISPEVVPIL